MGETQEESATFGKKWVAIGQKGNEQLLSCSAIKMATRFVILQGMGCLRFEFELKKPPKKEGFPKLFHYSFQVIQKTPEQTKRFLPLATIVSLKSPLSSFNETKRKIDQAIK